MSGIRVPEWLLSSEIPLLGLSTAAFSLHAPRPFLRACRGESRSFGVSSFKDINSTRSGLNLILVTSIKILYSQIRSYGFNT